MITREQAEQAFREYVGRSNLTLAYEIRNLQFEPIDANEIGSYDDVGIIDLEKAGWRCIFEKRYKRGTVWSKANCYIVEAKPGPYVIE